MQRTAVTNKPQRACKAPAATALAALLAVSVAVAPTIASAQGGRVSIVRDAETEALLQDYVQPLMRTAGVRTGNMQIFIIPSDDFNAFVADGRRMFVNVGAIVSSETPNELIGVLAHETAHIAHQDNASLRQAVENTKAALLLASLLGVGAVVAGGLSGSQAAGAAAAGILTGVPTAGERSILAYRRAQESAADRSAIDYLNATGQSGQGLLTSMERLADQNLFLSRQVNPYVQSHPLPRDRIVELEQLVRSSANSGRTDPADLQRRHDLVRAKLIGFTWTPGRVQREYPLSDTSLPALYARAIATYRTGPLQSALQQIDGLIAAEPGNAYFWELKGQVLLESGNPQASLEPLRKAVSLAPGSGLVKILLGQALVANESSALAGEAIDVLTVGLQADPDASHGYRALARAYALRDQIPMAQLATAEGLLADGKVQEAKAQAERAQANLTAGSPAWLRASDIVSYNPPDLP